MLAEVATERSMQRHWMRMVSLVLLAVAAANAAWAQADYPNRPIRLISDSSPGSAVDTGLRIIADGMSKHWNQQVVLVNQPGAAGAISAQIAVQAAADGYTLYAPALSVFLAVPGKAPNLPLMVPRDFAAVGYTVDQPLAVGVSPKLGIKTLRELIELAKRKPGELSYAVTGVGGLAPAFQSGSLVPLAVGAAKRLPSVPDLPTISETVPGLIASGWQAVLTPNGTPEPIIAKASEGLRAALDMANVKEQLATRGSFARPMSPPQVTAFIRDQQELWKP